MDGGELVVEVGGDGRLGIRDDGVIVYLEVEMGIGMMEYVM